MGKGAKRVTGRVERKRALAFGLIMLLIMLIASLVSGYLSLSLHKKEENRLASTIGTILSESIQRISFSGKYHSRLLLEEMQNRLPELAYISVETMDGIIAAHTDSARNDTPISREARHLSRKALETGGTTLTERTLNGSAVKEVLLPYRTGFTNDISGVVRVGIKVEDARSKQLTNLVIHIIMIVVLTLSAVWIMEVLSRHFTRRLTESEEALRESEEKFRQITVSARDAIIMMDARGLILFWNPSAEDIFGHTRKEAIGQNLHQLLAPERYHTDHSDAFLRFLETGKGSVINKTVELEAIRKDGKEIPIELSLSTIHSKDGWNAVGIVRDITERKKTQEMLIQSEKMMSVGGLAAGMAHEINNPLAGMMQNANVIKSRLERIDMPANLKVAQELGLSLENVRVFMEKRGIFRMIDAIHDSGERAAEIVKSMLGFARQSDAAVSPLYPDHLMDEILELAATDYDLKKEYDFKSIEIVKAYAENLPMLPCEGAKIQQVLLNILRNGAQAMHAEKTESPRFIIRIYNEGEPEMVHMEIEDNGPGMDETKRSKVFDPFFTTKPVGVGTGLGLSVSYFIITENHKGSMDVISEPGKGANFIIRLPVDRK